MSEVPLYQDIGVQQLGLRRLILDAIALSMPPAYRNGVRPPSKMLKIFAAFSFGTKWQVIEWMI